MSDDSTESQEQGIEFGSLAEELENESYPLSQEELLSRYGDHELEFMDGSTTLREALSPENEREYNDAEGVRQAVFSMVGDEAIAREGYSDRGGNTPQATDSDEMESF